MTGDESSVVRGGTRTVARTLCALLLTTSAMACQAASTATVLDKNVPAVPFDDPTSILALNTGSGGLLALQVKAIQPLLAVLTTSTADRSALVQRCDKLRSMVEQGGEYVAQAQDLALLKRAAEICLDHPKTAAYDLAQTMRMHGEIQVKQRE